MAEFVSGRRMTSGGFSKGSNFAFDIRGIEDLQRRLKQLRTKDAIKYMNLAINEVANFMRQEFHDAAPIRTGGLKKSFTYGKNRVFASTASAFVWARKKGGYHAHLIERAHRKVVLTVDKFGRKKKVDKGMYEHPKAGFFSNTIENNRNLMLIMFRRKLIRMLDGIEAA